MAIPFVDLQRQYRENKAAIDRQIREVLDSSGYILGPKVEELERELAEFAGVRHAVGVSSGTDALLIALMALELKPGDEVITSPFTFVASAEVIALLSGVPVFVDVEPDTYNINSEQIERRITPRTRAIMPVDLFGQCADYGRIGAIARRHGLAVIEDAAQSFGAEQEGRKACSFGDIGCTSFYPSKPLGCYGDGGMAFTGDEEIAALLRSLRMHGEGRDRYENVRIGICGRLDAIQAAVLLGKLPALPGEIERRQRVAARYTESLSELVPTPTVRPGNLSVWAQYCIRVKNRRAVQERLKRAGIPTCVFYPRPLHLQKAFAHLGYGEGDFPVAEEVSRDILSLPMHPYLDEETQDFIISHLKAALESEAAKSTQAQR